VVGAAGSAEPEPLLDTDWVTLLPAPGAPTTVSTTRVSYTRRRTIIRSLGRAGAERICHANAARITRNTVNVSRVTVIRSGPAAARRCGLVVATAAIATVAVSVTASARPGDRVTGSSARGSPV
jgi:hypothetical protein